MHSTDAMPALMQGLGVLSVVPLGCLLLAVVTARKVRMERRRKSLASPAQPRPFVPTQRGGEQR